MKITMEPYTRYDSCLKPTFTFVEIWSGHFFSVNLYKEYTSLESRELEELPRFGVMTWQPFQLS